MTPPVLIVLMYPKHRQYIHKSQPVDYVLSQLNPVNMNIFQSQLYISIRSSTSRYLSSFFNETLKMYGLERGLRPLFLLLSSLLLLSVGTSNVQIAGMGQASF